MLTVLLLATKPIIQNTKTIMMFNLSPKVTIILDPSPLCGQRVSPFWWKEAWFSEVMAAVSFPSGHNIYSDTHMSGMERAMITLLIQNFQ